MLDIAVSWRKALASLYSVEFNQLFACSLLSN
jgi:hypothetical protein